MTRLSYIIGLIFFLSSCGESIGEEDIIGCWTIAYIDTDGIKMKGGKYSMCIKDNGKMTQQKADGKEKVESEWSLEADDSLLIIYYEDRMPDTAKIIKIDKRELHLERKIKDSKVTLYLRKQE